MENKDEINDQIRVRLEKMRNYRARGDNPYRNGLTPTHYAADLHRGHDEDSKEKLEDAAIKVQVAGRIMAIRSFGKAAFVQVQDRSERIQLFVQKNAIGEDKFKSFKDLDIGDIVFADGVLFKTKTNELSVQVAKIDLLTKALRPLPEKFHGLSDVETRYRQRYLDLITNKDSREVFLKRSKIVETIRQFFVKNQYIEVETPMLHPIAGGAAAKPFQTHHNTLDMELFLRIAPELYLKRLLVGGMDRVFEINRNFRNEGISIQHNPEFTMIEFYWAYATCDDLLPFTEELFREVGRAVLGTTKLTYQGTEIELGKPWERIKFEESILKYSGFREKAKIRDAGALYEYCRSKKYKLGHTDRADTEAKQGSFGTLQAVIFDQEVEEKLIQPTFVTHYPLDLSPLSRKNEKDPQLVDRFELFIYGREMANGFSELNDPIDQEERFKKQAEAKNAGDEEACDMDRDYIDALEYGMPPAAGEGIGIDRMVMLFTDSASIRDVILFPQLRRLC